MTNQPASDTPTPKEAREILSRFNASHWNNPEEHARYSIPADPTRDDDLRLAAFIDQAEKTQAELTRLSAEREKERTADVEQHIQNVKAIERLATDNDELRATLAERDRQLAEAKAQLEAARTQCQLRSAGHDDLRTRLNRLGAEHLESLRHLEEKDKLENELIAQLADSQRQKAELEGWLKDAQLNLTLIQLARDEMRKSDNCPVCGPQIETMRTACRLTHQSLRQSTQTEEKK